jgi:hypothetical protein
MPRRDTSPRRRQFVPSAIAALLTVALSSGFGFAPSEASAQSANANGGHAQNPAKSFKVPALPTGSGNVQIQPGMSKKDWQDAYKETGRPKFKQNTVKRVGGTVERD